MELRKNLTRVASVSRRDRALLIESLLWVSASAAIIAVLPFRRAIAFGSIPLGDARSENEPRLERISWSVSKVASMVPFRAVCFHQGLALQRMLRRRGTDALLHYGLGKAPSEALSAHVWVTVGDRILIGDDPISCYQAVATFP